MKQSGTRVGGGVSKAQEVPMDLWATLGVSRGVGIGAVTVAVAVLVGVVGRLLRRSRRPERVWVNLSGRG